MWNYKITPRCALTRLDVNISDCEFDVSQLCVASHTHSDLSYPKLLQLGFGEEVVMANPSAFYPILELANNGLRMHCT